MNRSNHLVALVVNGAVVDHIETTAAITDTEIAGIEDLLKRNGVLIDKAMKWDINLKRISPDEREG